MYYHTCPYCNANLDPGETCDCRKIAEDKEKEFEKFLVQSPYGQLSFDCDTEKIKKGA